MDNPLWANLGTLLVALLFSVVGFFLCLIAKFYRLKFNRGPGGAWMGICLILLVVGLILQSGFFANMPGWIPAMIVCSGGLGFSLLSLQLYRSMMSI